MAKHRFDVPVPALDMDRVKRSAADIGVHARDLSARAVQYAPELAHQARDAATVVVDKVQPRVADAYAWARPRARKAWQGGVQAAAPHVESLAGKAGPLLTSAQEKLHPAVDVAYGKVSQAIDVAHEKLLTDMIPRLVAAVNAAAAQAGGADSAAARAAAAAADKLAKKKRRRRRVTVVTLVGAAVAGFALWRRAQPVNDPWAQPWNASDDDDADQEDPRVGAARLAAHVASLRQDAVAHAQDVANRAQTVAVKAQDAATAAVHTVADKAKDAAHEAVDKVKAAKAKPQDAAGEPAADSQAAAG